MKNKKWGILLAVFSMMCMLAMSLTGFAAGPLDGQIVDGSLLTSKSYSEDRKELTVESEVKLHRMGRICLMVQRLSQIMAEEASISMEVRFAIE